MEIRTSRFKVYLLKWRIDLLEKKNPHILYNDEDQKMLITMGKKYFDSDIPKKF